MRAPLILMYCYRQLFRTGLDAREVHGVRKAVEFSVS